MHFEKKPLPPINKTHTERTNVVINNKILILTLDNSIICNGKLLKPEQSIPLLEKGTCWQSRIWLRLVRDQKDRHFEKKRLSKRDASYQKYTSGNRIDER